MFMKIVKCRNSKCDVRYRYNDIIYPFYNDPGYIVLKCRLCGSLTKVRVENHDIFKYLVHGDVVANWGLDEPDKYPDIESSQTIDWKEVAISEIKWVPLNKNPFWKNKTDDAEIIASQSFDKNKAKIDKEFLTAYNFALKSRFFDKAIFFVDKLKEGNAVWGCDYKNENSLDTKRLYLIDFHDKGSRHLPNGLYTRDEIFVYLQRLLKRWFLLSNQVVIATPFIGLPYRGKSQEGVVHLWKLLNEMIDINKTTFITRKSTFTLLKNAQNAQGADFDFLSEWGLNDPLQNAADKGNLEFFTKFHAKFYAGIFDDYVEVMSGSFNVQTGSYLEQIVIERYDKNLFKERFLDPLCKDFKYLPSITDQNVYLIERSGDSVSSRINVPMKSFISQDIMPIGEIRCR